MFNIFIVVVGKQTQSGDKYCIKLKMHTYTNKSNWKNLN